MARDLSWWLGSHPPGVVQAEVQAGRGAAPMQAVAAAKSSHSPHCAAGSAKLPAWAGGGSNPDI